MDAFNDEILPFDNFLDNSDHIKALIKFIHAGNYTNKLLLELRLQNPNQQKSRHLTAFLIAITIIYLFLHLNKQIFVHFFQSRFCLNYQSQKLVPEFYFDQLEARQFYQSH